MHSIVVYGDYRRHLFDSGPTAKPQRRHARGTINGWIQGGVFLMRQAVEGFLTGLPFDSADSEPGVFSFAPFSEDSTATGFEHVAWTLGKTTLDAPLPGTEAAALRLTPLPAPNVYNPVLPRMSLELENALGPYRSGRSARTGLPPGYFDPPGKGVDYCPDIVVFDDLAGTMRDLDLSSYGRWSRPPREPRLVPEIATWRVTRDFDGQRDDAFAEGLTLLLARLRHAVNAPAVPGARRVGRTGTPNPVIHPLEPVIVCSVRGCPPRLDDVSPTSFWGVLYGDSRLRQRTVVLLDAADLRGALREDPDQRKFRDGRAKPEPEMAISSGLSWEATAQDTITELRRSKYLRRFLDFSQVVVRFGYCAALHISRHGDREWNYQLHYDPQRDDATWTDLEKQGTVLGESALFAGAIVRHLTRVCLEHDERPVLQDLTETVGGALPDALRAAQRLINLGYGTLKQSVLTERNPNPGGPSRNFADEVFQDTLARSAQPFASATVPALRNRVWSLLSAATQTRSGRVAREIVRYGAPVALFQQVPTATEYTEALTDQIAERLATTPRQLLDIPPARGQAPVPALLTQFSEIVREVAVTCFDRLTCFPSDRKKALGGQLVHAVADLDLRGVSPLLRAFWNARRFRIGQLNRFHATLNDVLYELALATGRILRRGLELPFSTDPRFEPMIAPVYRVGRQTVVDRREIEGVRELRNLIKLHLDEVSTNETNAKKDPTVNTPLSLAIFGPPGAGKSAAVRAIIKTLDKHEAAPEALGPYNLAEFSGIEDLHGAFKKIVDARARSRVPIVFFDEFDSRFQGEEWGWLKFFLAPMEDGMYRDQPVHTAVFVFAGGTSATYADFSLRNRPSTDPRMQEFVRAKGPDFVSRLKGHLDVVGVNPADSDDDLYLIRRAVIVRSILAKIQGLEEDDEARIDRDVLRATLFVPRYRNGARSIRKLIEMCPGAARRVTNGALPPINQLNMVTDGAAFLDLLSNVSAEEYESRS